MASIVLKTATSTTIYGTKLNSAGEPVVNALVVVRGQKAPPAGTSPILVRTTTDKNGDYSMTVDNLYIWSDKHYIEFYGRGLVQKLVPKGDWEEVSLGALVQYDTQDSVPPVPGIYNTVISTNGDGFFIENNSPGGTIWLRSAEGFSALKIDGPDNLITFNPSSSLTMHDSASLEILNNINVTITKNINTTSAGDGDILQFSGLNGANLLPVSLQSLTVDVITTKNMQCDTLTASTKNFKVPYQGKRGYLTYTCLEGPENAVFFRGSIESSGIRVVIQLPKEWEWLVNKDTITVQVTPIGKWQKLYYEIKGLDLIIKDEKLLSNGVNCSFIVFAERQDVPKLKTYSVA